MKMFKKNWLVGVMSVSCCLSLSAYADNVMNSSVSVSNSNKTVITTYKTVVNTSTQAGEPFFEGKAMACAQQTGEGGTNCCSLNNNSASCTTEEQSLAEAKSDGLAAFVGNSCIKNMNGSCVEQESVYCVFPDRVSYMIQTQGRVKQLNQTFGTPEQPDCSGLTADQIKNIDLTSIDFSSKPPVDISHIPMGPGPVILPNDTSSNLSNS